MFEAFKLQTVDAAQAALVYIELDKSGKNWMIWSAVHIPGHVHTPPMLGVVLLVINYATAANSEPADLPCNGAHIGFN